MRYRRYLRVFLASPGDVDEERVRMARVIRQLNTTLGESEDVTIDLVRWETHTWPGFGEDAQAVINEQTEPGDIFVGILWRRIGTPTKRGLSGTVEECERAYRLWQETERPRIMLYFNTEIPSTHHTEGDDEQYRAVTEFQERLAERGAYYWEYRGTAEFEEVVFPHLYHAVLKQIAEPAEGETPAEAVRPAERVEPADAAKETDVQDVNARLVLRALEQSRSGQGYRTVNGLSAETGLSANVVERVLNAYPKLVMRSRLPDVKGQALFKYRR